MYSNFAPFGLGEVEEEEEAQTRKLVGATRLTGKWVCFGYGVKVYGAQIALNIEVYTHRPKGQLQGPWWLRLDNC